MASLGTVKILAPSLLASLAHAAGERGPLAVAQDVHAAVALSPEQSRAVANVLECLVALCRQAHPQRRGNDS